MTLLLPATRKCQAYVSPCAFARRLPALERSAVLTALNRDFVEGDCHGRTTLFWSRPTAKSTLTYYKRAVLAPDRLRNAFRELAPHTRAHPSASFATQQSCATLGGHSLLSPSSWLHFISNNAKKTPRRRRNSAAGVAARSPFNFASCHGRIHVLYISGFPEASPRT